MTDIKKIPASHLQANPFQPREKVKKEDLMDLIESIRIHGVLEPLVVAETPAGYQIIAGERRWRAAKVLGIEELPVYVKKTSPQGMLEMAIVENVQRTDLNPIERAQSFARLSREFGLSIGEMAQRIGKSSSYISNTIRLLDLPDAINDGLLSQQITEGHARSLVSLKNPALMIACYKQVLKENASVRRTEELVRRIKAGQDQATQKYDDGRGRPLAQDEEQVARWEDKLQHYFKNNTTLKVVRSRKQTKVTITLKGSPDKTQLDLEKLMNIAK
ncbi:MAG: ParB/RepB/Spo0J family partition protein [Candidatus Pacebacteria bacterium]|nr:ParB/RepB/Spo0J family partition protein [Candidatus Paceibacterota bacterium]